MLKIRRSLGRLIFNMGIAIPGKTVFLIETAPRYLWQCLMWYHVILYIVDIISFMQWTISMTGTTILVFVVTTFDTLCYNSYCSSIFVTFQNLLWSVCCQNDWCISHPVWYLLLTNWRPRIVKVPTLPSLTPAEVVDMITPVPSLLQNLTLWPVSIFSAETSCLHDQSVVCIIKIVIFHLHM